MSIFASFSEYDHLEKSSKDLQRLFISALDDPRFVVDYTLIIHCVPTPVSEPGASCLIGSLCIYYYYIYISYCSDDSWENLFGYLAVLPSSQLTRLSNLPETNHSFTENNPSAKNISWEKYHHMFQKSSNYYFQSCIAGMTRTNQSHIIVVRTLFVKRSHT